MNEERQDEGLEVNMKQVAISVIRVLAAAALFLSAHLAQAAIRLPHVFGNNMVLQQGQHVPVWGKASPGEIVTVSFAGQSVRATAGADGRWRVDQDGTCRLGGYGYIVQEF